MLQDVGILATSQDQKYIKKGKSWRIHYWILKKREILRLANLKDEDKIENGYKKIYNRISNDFWSRDELIH